MSLVFNEHEQVNKKITRPSRLEGILYTKRTNNRQKQKIVIMGDGGDKKRKCGIRKSYLMNRL